MEPGTVNAVGVWFYSLNTQRYLYLMRNDPKYPGSWGLPGGKAQPGESLLDALQRECQEEIGQWPDYVSLAPLEQFTSADDSFVYHTFFCCVGREFQPYLNNEHLGYAWIDAMTWPRPMHPGLWNTVNLDAVRHKIDVIINRVQISQ
jgi:8-oxo-dGTP pyrophosphatase MutT (NUDIX family)